MPMRPRSMTNFFRLRGGGAGAPRRSELQAAGQAPCRASLGWLAQPRRCRKVGDLVWGLAHLESDGLSCDSTVGLRSTDVETDGNKRANAQPELFPKGHSPIGRRPGAALVQLPL